MLKIFITLLFILPTTAWAGPTSSVSSTRITEGKSSTDLRLGYSTDDERSNNQDRIFIRQTLDHAFTDHYALRLVTRQNKLKSDHIEHDDFSLQHRFHLIDREKSGWDGGIRLAYTNNASNADEVEFRTIAQVPFGDGWEYRNNMIFSHEVGAQKESGIGFEGRHEVNKKIGANKIGFDLLNDFGSIRELNGYSQQDHEAGIFIQNKLPHKTTSTLGYRKGISRRANDHAIRLFLKKDF